MSSSQKGANHTPEHLLVTAGRHTHPHQAVREPVLHLSEAQARLSAAGTLSIWVGARAVTHTRCRWLWCARVFETLVESHRPTGA